MAASKKNAKGSKTAHVLNLLTAPGAPKEGPSAAGEPTAEGAETAAAPARPRRPPSRAGAETHLTRPTSYAV